MNNKLFEEFRKIAGWTDEDVSHVTFIGQDPVVRTTFKVGEAISAAQAACGLAAAKLWQLRTGHMQHVTVDMTEAVASLNSYMYVRLDDLSALMQPAAETDSADTQANLSLAEVLEITGSYLTKDDRWFYVHASTDSTPILKVLDCDRTHDTVKAAVAQWNAQELEDAFIANGANGGICRSAEEWANTEQGKILSALPLVEIKKVGSTPPMPLPEGSRPLSGIRTLDLTRVLSGPTTAKALAEQGSEVLWIGAPHLSDVPFFMLDTSHGKRAAFLDTRKPEEKERLWGLVSRADVFCQSYRLGSKLSEEFSAESVTSRFPGIIYTHVTAFGQEGPWATNPGWEQVGQAVTGIQLQESKMPMAPMNEDILELPCGILYANMHASEDGQPRTLPSAYNDYMTGYMNAFGTMVALYRRAVEGGTYVVNTSLAKSSMALADLGYVDEKLAMECGDVVSMDIIDKLSIDEYGDFGHLEYLGPTIHMSETPAFFDKPTVKRGSSAPLWLA